MSSVAPVPRKKEGRAARLAAMMESQGMSTEGTALEGLLQQEREAMERENATADLGSVDGQQTTEEVLSPDEDEAIGLEDTEAVPASECRSQEITT